ncbi:helix-turn-helix domain-containing protein [Nocardia sp. NPDC049707]|uniref:TetR/AcrR family transcriptional regulator n=1 Tax=Nocardia sp. NPDC049707 TaxID=3154735 RepID=UPI003434F351
MAMPPAISVVIIRDRLPDLPPAVPPGPTRPGVAVSARRTAILNTATELFADQGFSNVGMEDIGRAVGMAGPSLYNHFAGKTEILEAACLRSNEWLQRDLDRALAEADDETDALRRIPASYADFALERPADVRLLLTESVELPEPQGHRVRVLQHQYIAEWVQLLRRVHPRVRNSVNRSAVRSKYPLPVSNSTRWCRDAMVHRHALDDARRAVTP